MATATATCPACEAKRDANSTYCWRCYTQFGAQEAAGASTFTPGAETPVGAPSQAGGLPQPAAPPPSGTVTSPSRTRSYAGTWRNLNPLVKWVIGFVIGFLAAGAVLKLTGGSKVNLPDSIAGVPKVENPAFEAFAESLAESIETSGAGASYGSTAEVDFAVMAFAGHDDVGPAQRMNDVAAGPTFGVTIQTSRTKSFTNDETDLACAPFVGDVRGIVCLWRDAETVGIVYDYNVARMPQAYRLALQVHESVRG